MDKLTKSTYFILIKISFLLDKLAEIFINVIVKLHGIPSSIIFNRDMRFMLRIWESLYATLGTKLKLSFTYHSHIYGQTKRII